MKPHKHAEVIKAWADGVEVEFRAIPEQSWSKLEAPFFYLDFEYRIKPEKVYPVTRMTSPMLTAAFDANLMLIAALENVANAALRHAIDAGQVVDPSTYMADVREQAGRRNARRDMAIARAVGAANLQMGNLSESELAAIIATVNERK